MWSTAEQNQWHAPATNVVRAHDGGPADINPSSARSQALPYAGYKWVPREIFALISAGYAGAVEGGGHGLSGVCAQDPAVGGTQQGICVGTGVEGSEASAVATHISVSSPLIRSSLRGRSIWTAGRIATCLWT